MNYRETNSPGTAWRRCYEVQLLNPLDGLQCVRFAEQDVADVGGRVLTTPAHYIEKAFDPVGQFDLLDPETGQPTGLTMTHAALYQALFSLYLQVATKRDTPPKE